MPGGNRAGTQFSVKSLASHISTSLQQILVKPLIFTKFVMINRSMEVVVCFYEKYEKLLFCVTLVKRSI